MIAASPLLEPIFCVNPPVTAFPLPLQMSGDGAWWLKGSKPSAASTHPAMFGGKRGKPEVISDDGSSSGSEDNLGGARLHKLRKPKRRSGSRKSKRSKASKKSKKSRRSGKGPNKWVQFLTKEAAKRGIEYGVAMGDKSIRAKYHRRG